MRPESRQAPGRATPGGPLSSDQILEVAQRIVETEGLSALTIRGLAAKLGVAVTAVYWHVGDKHALLEGLAARIIDEMGEITATGRGAQTRVASIARILRVSLLERPELVALVHRQGRTAALFQPARKVLVAELRTAGLGDDQAALAAQAILSLVVGSVLIDRQVERQPAQRDDTDDLLGHDAEVGDVALTPVDEATIFDYTLDVLVKSILGQ
jgi:TetR/AcrR family transcriptional regulator, tetracycline repressor protein